MMPQNAAPIIVALARKYRLDPEAVLAVARGEGGTNYGAVGDGGHAFGPFQLNDAGGVLTGRPGDHASFANSPEGLEFALRGMANAGAAGLTGAAAVKAIIGNYERPADKATSIRNALGRLGSSGVSPAPAPQMGASPTPTPAAPPGVDPRAARKQALLSLLQARRSGNQDRTGVFDSLTALRAAQAQPAPSPAPSPLPHQSSANGPAQGRGRGGLEALFAKLRAAGAITSGERSPEHNRAVGGSPTSYHLTGDGVTAEDVDPKAKQAAALIGYARAHPAEFKEFFGPFDWKIKNGHYSAGRFPDHDDHIHAAR